MRGFDVPFDLIRDWDPTAIPPIDGELTSTEVSLAQSGLHPDPTVQGSSGVEHEPEFEASQVEDEAEDDPMDVDLESIPEEMPGEAEPEVGPKKSPY